MAVLPLLSISRCFWWGHSPSNPAPEAFPTPATSTARKGKALQGRNEFALQECTELFPCRTHTPRANTHSQSFKLAGSWKKKKKEENLHINFAWLEMATAIPGNLTALIKKKKAHNSCMGVFCWPSSPPCPSLLPFPSPNLHCTTSTNDLGIKYPPESTSCLLKDFLRLQSLKYLSKSRVQVV